MRYIKADKNINDCFWYFSPRGYAKELKQADSFYELFVFVTNNVSLVIFQREIL